ncbi:MAG: Tol-Pal system subunit TolQ, partial [Proteobacteria bacterium]|nr:Tol-Pal system subunit TolQ [Pseudomonadota bacterium]
MSDPVSTAVQGVDSVALAGTQAVHSFSMYGMFMQADLVVKLVMIMLLLASMWC